VRQFEIRWADLPGPVGRRPVLLLSRTPSYEYLSKVIVVEITTRIRAIPQEVRLGRREGLHKPCVANFDSTHVIAKSRIGEPIGMLHSGRHSEAKRALGYALDWPELKVLA
jgi:mRNA interferase MazF